MSEYDENDKRRNLIAPHVDTIIDSFIPDHIEANYPDLIAFVRAYLKYLEESNQSAYYQNTLPQQRDIRTQDSEFLKRIEKEIGLFAPREFESDPKLFYDRISDLWRSKGSQEAIQTFFRIFLNDPVQIRLPWEQVLIPSDGRWSQNTILRVSSINGDPRDFAGKVVVQIESFASAVVSQVDRRVYADGIIWELTLVKGSVVGEFFDENTVTIEDDINTRAEVYRSVSEINILDGGTNYEVGDRVFLEGLEGVTFIANVSRVDDDTGEILNLTISNFGSGNTPEHIKETNTSDEYFLEDFLLYEYDSGNAQVGQSTLEFSVETIFGSGASFSVSYNPLVETEGRYIGVKGQLSESIVLQDSFFYQKYSYEVITNFPIDIWEGSIKRTVSPAGTIAFANVRVFDTLDLEADAQLFRFVTTPAVYNVTDTQVLGETIVAFAQDYTVGTDFFFLESYVGDEVTDQSTSSGTNSDSNAFTTQQI